MVTTVNPERADNIRKFMRSSKAQAGLALIVAGIAVSFAPIPVVTLGVVALIIGALALR